MLKVAIVEDEDEAAALLEEHLKAYGEKTGSSFCTVRYKNPVTLLTGYPSDLDIIFMDIDMPMMDGMEASRRLRELDNDVALVFVTNLAQLAIKGYEVQALDFIVKPVSYYDFAMKMEKIERYVERRGGDDLVLSTGKGMVRLNTAEISYVETRGHQLVYHTARGLYTAYGSLKTLEADRKLAGFARCNACYLVNLRYVRAVTGYTVTVGDDALEISRPKRKSFVMRLNQYLGEIT